LWANDDDGKRMRKQQQVYKSVDNDSTFGGFLWRPQQFRWIGTIVRVRVCAIFFTNHTTRQQYLSLPSLPTIPTHCVAWSIESSENRGDRAKKRLKPIGSRDQSASQRGGVCALSLPLNTAKANCVREYILRNFSRHFDNVDSSREEEGAVDVAVGVVAVENMLSIGLSKRHDGW